MTEEHATYVTAEGKARAALEAAKLYIDSRYLPDAHITDRMLKQIDDALAMGTDDIKARTIELHSHDVPDLKTELMQGLDDMKSFIVMQSGGHIRQQLYQLPEQIQEQALTVSKLTADIEKLRVSITSIKNQKLELVLCATNDGKPLYTNDKARNLAVETLLREDKLYLDNCDELGRKESELRREQIRLEFLHNQFKAYLAIAGMNGVR